MITAGVDLGARKAAISLHDGKITWVGHLEVPKTTRARELRTLAAWSEKILRVADFVFVEEPLVGRGVRASLQIAHTAGAVLSCLKDDIYSDFVAVKSWKKDTVGNGNASKEQVAMWLKSSHPSYHQQCAGNQDRVDAVCIGLHGVRIGDRSRELANPGRLHL